MTTVKYRSVDAAYEKDGLIYSAWQRREIVEMTVEYNERETANAKVEVIGHWVDYEAARAKVKNFNRKQHEDTSRR
jgi:hypothetical protein